MTTQPFKLMADQPQDQAGPGFREAWEAQAFAMALLLHRRGVFTWTEWAASISAEIKAAQAAGDPDLEPHIISTG